MAETIRVTVWNEFQHERESQAIREIYPEGIHKAIAHGLSTSKGIQVRTATLDEPEHGLTEEIVDSTDVLLWWGHKAHDRVDDRIVTRVQLRVLSGMGLIVLHSAHMSKIFRAVLGTGCTLKWREAGERERLWNIEPGHPITQGIGEYIELPNTEMYGERFDIPSPDRVLFISWFEGGEVFRSGCTFERGNGRIFYFRPGHETFPIYYNQSVIRILANAVRWAKPRINAAQNGCPKVEPLEKIHSI